MDIEEILIFIKHNNVKFIRLAFCDIFGTLKNLTINSKQLKHVIDHGLELDASAVSGIMNISKSDLLLFPDLETMSVIPWRPTDEKVVRFFCDMKHPDGSVFEGDGRDFLRHATEACEAYGYTPKISIESEFYLFKCDELGQPTNKTFDQATTYDVSPLNCGEDICHEICLTLEEMNIKVKTSYHEKGPGQYAIVLEDDSALKAADNLIAFKHCVKNIAVLNALHASFLPKPLQHESGSGLRIKVSLSKNDRNIFEDDYEVDLEEQRNFIAGVLNRIYEMSAFLNPIHNSYLRLGREKAPKYITWAKGNESQLIRVDEKEDEYSYIMLRSTDASCNPYYAYGLLLYAGIEGMKRKEKLSQVSTGQDEKMLPQTLSEAIDSIQHSTFINSRLDKNVVKKIIDVKYQEIEAYRGSDAFDQDVYFKLI